MTDRIGYLKYVGTQDPITPSQYRSWRQNPVTKALLKDLVLAVFDELDSPLPETFDQTIITVHQREGAMKLIDQLILWEPESVANARIKALNEGKNPEEIE